MNLKMKCKRCGLEVCDSRRKYALCLDCLVELVCGNTILEHLLEEYDVSKEKRKGELLENFKLFLSKNIKDNDDIEIFSELMKEPVWRDPNGLGALFG